MVQRRMMDEFFSPAVKSAVPVFTVDRKDFSAQKHFFNPISITDCIHAYSLKSLMEKFIINLVTSRNQQGCFLWLIIIIEELFLHYNQYLMYQNRQLFKPAYILIKKYGRSYEAPTELFYSFLSPRLPYIQDSGRCKLP